jgi:xanthine dehydrogenase accessory factor
MANRNIYLELLNILQQNTPCVMATVVAARGSTPQKPGSSAIIGTAGLLAGTVGGGLVEHQVLQQSRTAIDNKESILFSFDLGGELSRMDDVICGGNMSLLLDASPEDHLPMLLRLKASLSHHVPGILLTLAESPDDELLIRRYWFTKEDYPELPESVKNIAELNVREMLGNVVPGEFRNIPVSSERPLVQDYAFLETIAPLPSLVIAGAGHIGKALAHLGQLIGFEVTVWDDRSEFANKVQIPDAHFILTGALEESLAKQEVNEDTYVVIVTRGHKNDAEVLRNFIGSGAAYIGMIGSKAKISQMHERFVAEGWATPEQWERIYAPIGLKIGALTVEEIAVSIAAQLIQVRNQKGKKA